MKISTEIRELLGLKQVLSVIKNGRFVYVGCKNDVDWVKCGMTVEDDGTTQRDFQGRLGRIISRRM